MFLFFSCKENSSEENREGAVLVRIGDKALTRGDLEREIPDRLKSKDSALFADNYIKQWVDDQLLYDVASRNIPDKENIDRMVERYRQYVPLGIPSKFYYIDLMTGFQPVFLLYFAGAASLWSIF